MEASHYLQAVMPDFEPFTVRSIAYVNEDLEINDMFDAVHVMTVCLQFPDMWTLSKDDLKKVSDALQTYVYRSQRRLKERVEEYRRKEGR